MSRVRLRVHWPATSAGRGADDIENIASLLLHSLAMDCLPRICLHGKLFTTGCLAMGVHVTLLPP
jgi:hypothetical protein